MNSHASELTAEEHRWFRIVREMLKNLRFGVVQIVVQDAKVVQVEKTERVRISPAS